MKSFFKNNWLTLLIALQPLLDLLSFFGASAAANIIRLAIAVLLLAAVPLTRRATKAFWIALAVTAFYCALHVLNGFRVGYISPAYDLACLAKILQAPVLALCLSCLIRDDQTARQAFRGLWIAGGVLAVSLIAACLTRTGTWAGDGSFLYIWTADESRGAFNASLITLAAFALCLAVRSGRKLWAILLPVPVTAILLLSGSKSCAYALFVILGGFFVYLLIEGFLNRFRFKKRMLLLLAALMVLSLAYRTLTQTGEAQTDAGKQGEIEAELMARGVDIGKMTTEQRFQDQQVREVFALAYKRSMADALPDLFERFGADRVLLWFDMSTDLERVSDLRQIKLCYSGLLWEECDAQTKLVGFEVSQLGLDGSHELENDWPALLYCYGYAGLALYAAFVLYFVLRLLHRLLTDFRVSFTAESFTLALALGLLLGLAQYSGAVLRQPGVSVWLAVVLGQVWHLIRGEEEPEEAPEEIAEAAPEEIAEAAVPE